MKTVYSPSSIEKSCLTKWSHPGYFSPKASGNPYCIVLPPPNVTGHLHIGHGFQVSIMDALIRYHRLRGYRVLWQGGTDHAGIATQMVVERMLLAQGKKRDTVPREKLLSTLLEWKTHSEHSINLQLQRLGASIDFERNRFTLDAGFEKAVQEMLVVLNEEGLLYRGKRLVNWDPHLLTAISDLEVLRTEESGWLYYIHYSLADTSNKITVATTRPETLFGDTAIAVNPKDERYQHLIGQRAHIPIADRTIPIIADSDVDPNFGTGCVKITPAHDFNDYKIGQRHQLPLLNILTAKATLNTSVPTRYQGMDCMAARQLVLKDLQLKDSLAKQESRMLNVPRGDRSNAVIEPYLTEQWFIKMKPLAAKAIQAIEANEVQFFPDNWKAISLQWLTNIEDWCISRQLWWGHRIPAWYTKEGHYFVGRSEEEIRRRYKIDAAITLTQDQDVLDTWVSSALWPFATLGWPEPSSVLDSFYPTNVLVTGFDILFFWVARMLMMGLHFTKKVPFKEVYVTGLIRDHLGQKMSKSKANVLDPLDVIEGIKLEALVAKRKQGLMQLQMADKVERLTREQFPNGIDGLGADALRMTYYSLASPTRDVRFDMNRTLGYRNFCNKLWQVTRFVNSQYSLDSDELSENFQITHTFNLWILSRLQTVIDKAHHYFSSYRFDHLTQLLYDFVWHDYCDWYVELIKPILQSEEQGVYLETRYTLTYTLSLIVQLLHPLMPFVTEAVWETMQGSVSGRTKRLFQEMRYPVPEREYINSHVEEEIAWMQQVIKAIRSLKSDMNIPASQLVFLTFKTEHENIQKSVKNYQLDIERFVKGSIREESVAGSSSHLQQIAIRMNDMTWFVSFDNTRHAAQQVDKLQKEKVRLEKEIHLLQGRISSEAFTLKAPRSIIQKTQVQLDTAKKKLADVNEKL